MPMSIAELVKPSLVEISENAAGRRFTELRHEAYVSFCLNIND